MEGSKIKKELTISYIKTGKENQNFDRKSAKIDPKDLANNIAGFANGNGGTIAVGIADKGKIEGFENYENKYNDFLKIIGHYLKPIPEVKDEKIEITNSNGNKDYILLFHIQPTEESIVRNVKDEVYQRYGDSTVKLTNEQIKILKVDRPEISYENEINIESSIDDIDFDMVEIYKKAINAEHKDSIEVLKAKQFVKEVRGKLYLTNAGVLLFAQDPTVILPTAKVRVVKYSGNIAQTGVNLNIIKDETFRLPLYKMILELKKFIGTQLRDFTYLNKDGIFETVPEYPEFAWLEGVTNAITHRNYAITGDYIKVLIFDDRMEIKSPGKLAGFVTIPTMKEVRFSRNIKISETLTALGLVKELNEGVGRIYEEMKNFFLDKPQYTLDGGDNLKLTLKNNIVMRDKRAKENLQKNEKIKNAWDSLSPVEKDIIRYISERGEVRVLDLMEYTGRARNTILIITQKLMEINIIDWKGTSKFDPKKKFIIKE